MSAGIRSRSPSRVSKLSGLLEQHRPVSRYQQQKIEHLT